MAKKDSNFINMVSTLLVVTLVSSVSLSMVYNLTKLPIEKARLANINAAIQEVVPAFDNKPGEEVRSVWADGDSLRFYPATQNGELKATVVESFTNKGFSGTIRIMVGFLPDGTIHKLKVIEHKETPGLGDKMELEKSDFSRQFFEINPNTFNMAVRKDGGDVDAITAATITSRAFCDAVQRANKYYLNEMSAQTDSLAH